MNPASKTSKFLEELVDELDLLLTFGYHPAAILTYGMEGVRRMRSARERKWRREAMRRLEKRKAIRLSRRSGESRIALTEKGAEEVLRMKMNQSELLPDGIICLVVFDVPESKKDLRDQLRALLEAFGFAPLQKSVWISRFDVATLLQDFFYIKNKKWTRQYQIRIFNAHEPTRDTKTSRSRRK